MTKEQEQQPCRDLSLCDALSALRKAQGWLNEKHDAPVRAKLHHASVKIQEAMQYIRQARLNERADA